MTSFGARLHAAIDDRGPFCVGIDPHAALLHDWGLTDDVAGLETFALGFPIHLDWSWRTLFNRDWEDYIYSYRATVEGEPSGSKWLRKARFSLWIGYDF